MLSTYTVSDNNINAWHQQVFSVDAKYNSKRITNQPTFGILYIRRRNQLLRKKQCNNPELQSQYIKLRSELLQKRYGDSSDTTSLQSEKHQQNPETKTEPKHATSSSSFAGVHHVFDQHTAAISMVKFANNDPSRFCCASLDGSMSICDAMSSPPKVVALILAHAKGITAINWSTSNDLIVSSSLDTSIRLWCLRSDSKLNCLRTVSDQFRSEVLCCAFVPANNNFVVAGNSHGFLQVLNVSTGKYTRGGTASIGGKIMSLACEESGGSLIWTGNERGVITCFRLEAGSGKLSKLRRLERTGGFITSISWRAWLSKHAPWPALLVSSACDTLYLYRITNDHGSLVLWKKYPVKHKHHLVRSTFCPQMSTCLIATGSEDGSIHLIDSSKEGKAARVNWLLGHAAPTLSLCFNYSESLLASGDHQGLVILWSNHQDRQ